MCCNYLCILGDTKSPPRSICLRVDGSAERGENYAKLISVLPVRAFSGIHIIPINFPVGAKLVIECFHHSETSSPAYVSTIYHVPILLFDIVQHEKE
mmetsp:Transcript_5805/g.13244  ORF Transcript_5805/g.13244 Transcript_5805/m.13244 type:complete len:97 (-) Transcript_5805:105-395(-)